MEVQTVWFRLRREKSGFEALWFNFDRRNFATVNQEMLWHVAEYGPIPIQHLEYMHIPVQEEVLMDLVKLYSLYFQAIICLLTQQINERCCLYFLQYLLSKFWECKRYLGRCRNYIFMHYAGKIQNFLVCRATSCGCT